MVNTRTDRLVRARVEDLMQTIMDRLDQQQVMIEQQRQIMQQQQEMMLQLQNASTRRDDDRKNALEPQPLVSDNPLTLPQEQVQAQLTNIQLLIQFRKTCPPSFDGELVVEKAEAWIMQLEKIFEVMNCTSKQKVMLATFMLEREADHWWRSTKAIMQTKNIPINWENFLVEFYERYFPHFIRYQKEMEFINLKQTEEMSVDQYVVKFTKLSWYSFYLQKCDDENWKCRQFEKGLKPLIKDRVIPQRIRTFNDLVEVSRIIENNMRDIMPIVVGISQKETSELKRSRQEDSSSMDASRKKRKVSWNKKVQKGKRVELNKGQPLSKTCFKCGKPGHIARNCFQTEMAPLPRP